MKLAIFKFVSFSFILLVSCNDSNFAQTKTKADVAKNSSKRIADSNAPAKGYKYFEFKDEKLGMLSTRVQIPKDWKRSVDSKYLFEGPNDMKMGSAQKSPNYFYSEDPNMVNYYQMKGIQNYYPLSLDEITKQFFVPYAEQNDMVLVDTFPMPKLAEKNKGFQELNYTSEPTRYEVKSIGLEWKDNKGRRYITALNRLIIWSNNQLAWGFYNQHIECNSADYQKAKKIFIDVLMSEQHNTDWVFKKNQIQAQKYKQSYLAHQARMDALKLNSSNSSFTSSSSSSIGDTYSDILDISHSGYLKRSNMTSHGQTRTVNMISERNVISNHNTGEHYNVQAGSKYYWVNNNGKYFGTDNINYDPRIDNRINKTEWTQFKIEN